MNTATKNTTTSFLSENKKGMVVLFILFLLSSVGMFGQNKVVVANQVTTTIETLNTVPAQVIALDSDVDFVSWFMGARQTQNLQEATSTNTSLLSRKKQIISSGVMPNKVLYRTFVKKVLSQENAIV